MAILLDKRLVIANLGGHQPNGFVEASQSQEVRKLLPFHASVLRNEVIRLPLLTGLDRDVQVELVFCRFNPVPNLVIDPSGSFDSEESGLLHGWPLLN